MDSPVSWPDGLADIELYEPAAIGALFGAAIAGDADSLARLGVLHRIGHNPPAACMVCGSAFSKRPPVLGLVIAASRPGTALGFACCNGCYTAGPTETIRRLGTWLAATCGARRVCDGPEMVQ